MRKLVSTFLLLLSTNLFALSNEAQIDILKIKLVEQQKKGDYKAIINSIEQWKKIDSNLPISLVFWEGKAYFNTKEYLKSYKALEKYINIAGKDGRFYQDALKLYLKVEPKYKDALAEEQKEKESKGRVFGDNDTGLMWQDDYDVVSKAMTTNKAMSYCKSLNLASFDDWRLPTANEFITLIDFSKTPPVKAELKSIKRKGYLYQLIKENNNSKTYYVDLYSGNIGYYSSGFGKYYIRCVRDMK